MLLSFRPVRFRSPVLERDAEKRRGISDDITLYSLILERIQILGRIDLKSSGSRRACAWNGGWLGTIAIEGTCSRRGLALSCGERLGRDADKSGEGGAKGAW